nr:hypothetical protein [Rhodopirellula sp. SM50]
MPNLAKDFATEQTISFEVMRPPCELDKKISSLYGCQNDSKQRD